MKLLILFCLIFISGCNENNNPLINGKVVSVHDGDTISILDHSNAKTKIRLAGIDCPEKNQAWGNKAKSALSNIVYNEQVQAEILTTDRYQRKVAIVYFKGFNVNRALIANGECWAYTQYVKDEHLFKLQKDAQSKQIGIWGLPKNQQIEPWLWRKKP